MLRSRIAKIAAASLVAAALVLATAGVANRQFLRPALARWVAGDEFNRLLSHAVSSALKVEGKFGALRLEEGFSVHADGFTSAGWPGQAIGVLDTRGATGRFNPRGILRRLWEVDLINVDKADFVLRNPDDALKKLDPHPGPRPWYAFLMPSGFHCGWIECPDMNISLPLGQTPVKGEHLHVGATMIGKDFKYFGRNGLLRYEDWPTMDVDALEVYVTRQMIDIGYLYVRMPGSPHGNLRLAGRLGQHADKSINANAEITDLEIAPFLPADIANIFSGKLSGELAYATDTTGRNAHGTGRLAIANARLHDWPYLDRLAARARDESLRSWNFEQVSLDYKLSGNTVTVENLRVRGPRQLTLHGRGSWEMSTGEATASLNVGGIPLGAYLPPSISGSVRGDLSAQVDWAWRGTKLGEGRGGGTLSLANTTLAGFTFQKFLARFFKDDRYLSLSLSRANCSWKQDHTGLYLDNLDVIASGRAGLRGNVHIAPDGKLGGTLLAGLPDESLSWLPDATGTVFAKQEDGLHWCTVEISGTEADPKTNLTAQVLRQLEKHPVAMAELAMRGLSWWIGDMLDTGAAQDMHPSGHSTPRTP